LSLEVHTDTSSDGEVEDIDLDDIEYCWTPVEDKYLEASSQPTKPTPEELLAFGAQLGLDVREEGCYREARRMLAKKDDRIRRRTALRK
jgi:hypothetical protein